VPKVSVIVPTYNNPAMLVEAVESVLAQTYRDCDLYIIDDGSGPETREALEPYMSKLGYIRQENAGPSAARNRGIRESSGEYVAFLDHDDLWLPEKLAAQVEFMDAHPEYPISYHAVEYFSAENVRDWPAREGASGDVLAALFKRIFLITLSVMCRRECFEKHGWFDEMLRYAQDYEMWLRMALHCDFGYLDRQLGRYRYHAGQLSWENQLAFFTEKLAVRERIYADPAAKGRIPRKLYHREISSVSFKLAKMHLAKGNADEARRLISKSISHRRFEPRRWLFWLRARFA
jgi:glycosyltransferase involved in cell wall biosynthesis